MADYKMVCKLTSREDSVEVTRLVTAKNKAQAMAHIAKSVVTECEVATTADILALGAQGVQLEKAEAGS